MVFITFNKPEFICLDHVLSEFENGDIVELRATGRSIEKAISISEQLTSLSNSNLRQGLPST